LQGALLGVRTPRIHARMRLLAITLALFATLGAGQLLTARSAEAYNHSWGCSAYAYVQCYDVTGTQYNPWVWVYAYMSATSDTICAKGITANNNVRSPQACLAAIVRRLELRQGAPPLRCSRRLARQSRSTPERNAAGHPAGWPGSPQLVAPGAQGEKIALRPPASKRVSAAVLIARMRW
jgi:hypothetical protein